MLPHVLPQSTDLPYVLHCFTIIYSVFSHYFSPFLLRQNFSSEALVVVIFEMLLGRRPFQAPKTQI